MGKKNKKFANSMKQRGKAFVKANVDAAKAGFKMLGDLGQVAAGTAKAIYHSVKGNKIEKEMAKNIAGGINGADINNAQKWKRHEDRRWQGIDQIGKGLANTAKDWWAGTKNVATDLWKVIVNHPEWYTRFIKSGPTFNFNSRIIPEYTFEHANKLHTARYAKYLINVLPPIDSVVVNGETKTEIWSEYANAIRANKLSLLRSRGYGDSKYSDTDISVYSHNLAVIVSLMAKCYRMLCAHSTFSALDVTMPKDLLRVLYSPGYYKSIDGTSDIVIENDIDTVITSDSNNLAGLISRFNRIIQRIEYLVPGGSPRLMRLTWQLTNIFADNATPTEKILKNQYHLFDIVTDRTEYYELSPDKTKYVATGLNQQPLVRSVEYMLELVENKILKAMNIDTFNQIAADLIYTYGTAAFINMMRIEDDARLAPIFDEYALMQIQNSTVGTCCALNDVVVNSDLAKARPLENIVPIIGYNSSASITAFPSYKEPIPIINMPNATNDFGRNISAIMLHYRPLSAEKETSFKWFSSTTQGFVMLSTGSDRTNIQAVVSGYDPLYQIVLYGYTEDSLKSSHPGIQILGAIGVGNSCFLMPFGSSTSVNSRNLTGEFFNSWSFIDYMPQVQVYLYQLTAGGTASEPKGVFINIYANMIDIDQFAIVESRLVDQFHAMATNSLTVWTNNGDNMVSSTLKVFK